MLSLGRQIENGTHRRKLAIRVLRRGIILYCLGLLVYAFPKFDFSTLRFLGVLQRIAICYVIASMLYLWTGFRTQMICVVGLLAAYWILMMTVPVPGYGPGRLDVEGNLAHYIDAMVLGRHNYAETRTWDPEGIISTLPAIATALFGLLGARLLRMRRPLPERAVWLFLAGNCLLVIGLVCDVWLPINKKLWTSSFAIFMAGLDFSIFGACFWIIDGQGFKRFWRPFVILGRNAITVYMIAELLETTLNVIRWESGSRLISVRQWLYGNLFLPWLRPADASLLFAIAYVMLMLAIAYGMHRRGWFLRV